MRRNPICNASPNLSSGRRRSSGFLSRELEEHLHLEGRYLVRQVPPTEKCCVPAVHRAPPEGRTIHPRKTRLASH